MTLIMVTFVLLALGQWPVSSRVTDNLVFPSLDKMSSQS